MKRQIQQIINVSCVRKGVTLLELAIVLAIISILTVTAMGYYGETRKQATLMKALKDMNTIKAAIQTFRQDNHQPHGMNYPMRRPNSAEELVSVRFPDAEVTGSVHFLDSMPSTPWNLKYNIDLYNVIAFNTDYQVENKFGLWGKTVKVPYTDIHTDNFDGEAISSDIWTTVTNGTGGYSIKELTEDSRGVTLIAPHDVTKDDLIYLQLNKTILIKGIGKEGSTPVDLSFNKDAEWGNVVHVRFEIYQPNASSAVALTMDGLHAMDQDPLIEEKDMIGGILLWPESNIPQALNDPADVIAMNPCGIFFSNRSWRITGLHSNEPIKDPHTGDIVGQGNWGPGYHEIRFSTKYDSFSQAYLIDVSIDGDLKGSITNLDETSDKLFHLTIGPDFFLNPNKNTYSEMKLLSVSVNTVDFSKYYTDVLWKTNTYGRYK